MNSLKAMLLNRGDKKNKRNPKDKDGLGPKNKGLEERQSKDIKSVYE